MHLFESWMAKHGFDFKGKEKAERLAAFIENVKVVKKVNALKQGFKLGLNKFAHLRFDEFKAQYLGLDLPSKKSVSRISTSVDAISSLVGQWTQRNVDWRTRGAVTPVKDQGRCGEHGPKGLGYGSYRLHGLA